MFNFKHPTCIYIIYLYRFMQHYYFDITHLIYVCISHYLKMKFTKIIERLKSGDSSARRSGKH